MLVCVLAWNVDFTFKNTLVQSRNISIIIIIILSITPEMLLWWFNCLFRWLDNRLLFAYKYIEHFDFTTLSEQLFRTSPNSCLTEHFISYDQNVVVYKEFKNRIVQMTSFDEHNILYYIKRGIFIRHEEFVLTQSKSL